MNFSTNLKFTRPMEKDLIDIENEIQKLEDAKENPAAKENVNIEVVMECIGFYFEHQN